MPLVQTRLAQSAAATHFFPSAHVAHPDAGPPQSLSASGPFTTPSVHVGAWQTKFVHTLLAQSPASLQALVGGHATQAPPPQSTSVSVPFFTRSAHPASWQTLDVHTPFWQSVPIAQALPAGHRAHAVAPLQSLAVSPPFFTMSEHVGT